MTAPTVDRRPIKVDTQRVTVQKKLGRRRSRQRPDSGNCTLVQAWTLVAQSVPQVREGFCSLPNADSTIYVG